MEENYYALLLSIFKNVNAKDSVLYTKYGKQTNSFKRNVKIDRTPYKHVNIPTKKMTKETSELTKVEYKKIMKLKENHTWREIGSILNVTWASVYQSVRRYEKKKAIADGPTKTPLAIDFKNKTIIL